MKCLSDRVHVFTATAVAIAVVAAFAALRAQVVAPTAHTTEGAFGAITGGATLGAEAGEAIETQVVLGSHLRGRMAVDAVPPAKHRVGAVKPRLGLPMSAETVSAEDELGLSASTALRPAATVRAIHQYPSDRRRQLVDDVAARLDASAEAMARLQRQARTFAGQAKADFEAAAKAVVWREDQLRNSLEAASEASPESWADARAAVAADYAAYAEAVVRAEAVARAQRATPVSPPVTAPATTVNFTTPAKPALVAGETTAVGSAVVPPAVPTPSSASSPAPQK